MPVSLAGADKIEFQVEPSTVMKQEPQPSPRAKTWDWGVLAVRRLPLGGGLRNL